MSDDHRKLIAEADALRDRLAIELADWGKLCGNITTWVNEGRELRAEVRKLNTVLRERMKAWDDIIRRLLMERIDDAEDADWWKESGELGDEP